MYYITFNDQPSGIYQSQVLDVVAHLSEMRQKPITLVAFLPIQNFKKNKKQIKSQWTQSIIIPIVFGISRWKMHRLLLKAVTKKNTAAICRGPIANALSLGIFNKVVYDGRAAVKAEIEEYDITGGNFNLNTDFVLAEKKAILESDFRIAVSHKLVGYWKSLYNYSSNQHLVIPCTLTSKTPQISFNSSNNLYSDTIKIVYSGSTSGWQSFQKVTALLETLLQAQKNITVLFLTHDVKEISNLKARYENRVFQKYVSHDAVFQELQQCDYGILIREDNVTNEVASPVKFAEYLNAGLQVLISPNLGDFSQFVAKHNCGLVIADKLPILEKVSDLQKQQSISLALQFLHKSSPPINESYTKLLHFLSNETTK